MLTGKTINQLPEITDITTDAEFVVEQSGTTYKIKAANLHTGNLYGQFISTDDQFITGTTFDSYVMIADQTTGAEGISVVDGSKFTVSSAGTYNLQFSAQLDRYSGDSGSTFTIWLRQNGVDVPDSAGLVFAGPGAFVAKQVPSWNFIAEMEQGDYLELAWCTDNPFAFIRTFPPNLFPDRPGVPSVAITLTQI